MPNPRHRRSPQFAITEKGVRAVEALWAASEPHRRRALEASGVGVAELTRACETVTRLIEALSIAGAAAAAERENDAR